MTFKLLSAQCWIQRAALACTLFATGVLKLWFGPLPHEHHGPHSWQQQLTEGPLFLIVGIVEIGLGILLLSRYWRGAAFAVLGLLSLFWAFLLTQLVSKEPIKSCGCFGPIEIGFPAHLALVVGLFALALSAVLRQRVKHTASA